jgi:threonine aldolase
MKKLSVIMIAFLLLMGTTAFAASTSVATYKSSIAQEIENLLKKHDLNLEQDVMANVTFIVNDENEIVVLFIDTKDENIDRFVKSRLNYVKLDTNMTHGKEFKVPLKLLSED